MNICGLFNISFKLLLDENSNKTVNGQAGKGLKLLSRTTNTYYDSLATLKDERKGVMGVGVEEESKSVM